MDDLVAALSSLRTVAVASLSLETILMAASWSALIDARMRKRTTPPDRRGLVPVSIGLGPGFAAGENCDLAVETSLEALGQVMRAGRTLPLRGEPRAISGFGRERTVYAGSQGILQTARRIGDLVDIIAEVAGSPLRAPLSGALRGLVRDGVWVAVGAKVLEIDPRGDPALCFGLGERPRQVAQAVRHLLI